MRYFKENPNLRVLIINVTELDFVNNQTDYEQVINWVNAPYEAGMHVVGGKVLF